MSSSLIDLLVFSSLWVGGVAGVLCAAASLAQAMPVSWAVVGVAVTGTIFVYDVDRLRDLPRDLETTPLRSAFVARHYGALRGLAIACGAAAIAFGVSLGPRPALLLAPALLLGLLHRRIKDFDWGKSSYITAAWLLVVVGLPAMAGSAPERTGWVAWILGASLFANAIASNVRDREAAVAQLGIGRALAVARVVAVAGLVLALAAPSGPRALWPVPAATLAAILFFRAEERFGLVVVDGALGAGGLAAILLLTLG